VKRSGSLRRRVPVGAAARRRIKAGGVRSKARPSLSRDDYKVECLFALRRQHNLCLACGGFLPTLEVTDGNFHHVVKRSRGGSDDRENLVALCQTCHDRTEAPYSKGKLRFSGEAGDYRPELVFRDPRWGERRYTGNIMKQMLLHRLAPPEAWYYELAGKDAPAPPPPAGREGT